MPDTRADEIAGWPREQLIDRVLELERGEAAHRGVLAMLDAFPEILYVVDPETYEVLFVNHAFTERLGEDPIGKSCFEAFQGKPGPCEFCTNEQLFANPGEPYSWEHHNPILDMDFLITDKLIQWPDGRTVRFEVAIDVTDRKRAERELEGERHFTATVLDSLPGVFYVFDDGLRFRRWNTNFESVTGYSAEEIAALSPIDLFRGDDRERVSEQIREAFQTGSSQVGADFVARDGSATPYFFTGWRIVIEGATLLVGMGIDVSERLLAEREREESRRMLETVLDTIPQGVFWKDRDCRYLGCNAPCAAAAGVVSPAEIVGKTDDALAWAEIAEAYRADDQAVMESGVPKLAFEEPLTDHEGNNLWVRTSKFPLRTPGGEIYGVLGTFEDITAQRRLVEQVRESEQLLRRLVEDAPVPIMVHAEDGEVLELSRVWSELTGYPRSEISTTRAWFERAYGDAADEVLSLVKRLYTATSRIHDGEFEIATAHGVPIIWDFYSAPLGALPDGRRTVVSMAVDITARRAVEAALAESEGRFRATFEQAAVGVAHVAPDGTFMRINRRFCDIVGYGRKEMLSSTFQNITHPEDLKKDLEFIAQMLAGEISSYTMEKRYIRKDGAIVWVNLTVALVRDADDDPSYFIAVVEDISERKRADAALEASEERFRTIYSGVPVSIWEEDWSEVIDMVRAVTTDDNGDFRAFLDQDPDFVTRALSKVKILDVNHATLAMFAAEDKQQMLASLETVFATEDTLGGFVGELVALARGDRFYSTEMALRTVPGDLIHVLLTMTFPAPGSGSGRVLVSLMDITDRKRAELELLVFRRLVEAAGQGIGFAELNGTIRYLNPALCRMAGVANAAVLTGAPFLDLYPPEARRLLEEEALPAVLAGGDWHGSLAIRPHDGDEFPTLETMFLIHDDKDRPLYIGDVITDITDERRVQAELARSNADLQQFAYVASHDLQEPLRMVASYLQLLERRYGDKLDGEAREFIGFAVDGAYRMKALINDLLAFSRVGTHGRPFEAVDLSVVAAEVVHRLGPGIEEAGATVSVGELPVVDGDATQLDQLLQNLIGNAVKFHGEAPPTVSVSAQPADDGWRVEVADNGIGIPPEHRERIFEVFTRLHGGGAYPGTGIGLAICRKIVQRHGGRIWIEDGREGGTSVCFTLSHDVEAPHDA